MEEDRMARAIFSHELGDPDFQWLLSNYTEQKPTAAMVDAPCLPVVLVLLTPEEKAVVLTSAPVPIMPPTETPEAEGVEEPSTE
jgi:hypothetical protein